MTKKGKLILGWSIPALTVAVAAGLALPTIIFLDSEKREILNSSTNAQPSSFIAFTETEQKELFFNPKDYDLNFFLNNICSTPLVNSVFKFPAGFTFNKQENVWKNNQGVSYNISNVELLGYDENNDYVFQISIQKSYNDVKSPEYKPYITIPQSSFATAEKSKQNFASHSAKIIHNLFLNNYLKVISTKEVATSVSDFDSQSDVNIQSNNIISTDSSNNLILNNEMASSFYKNETTNFYGTNNSAFQYNHNLEISSGFTIPVAGNIWSSADYQISQNGDILETSPIYTFLASEYAAGHLTYLPELTAKEKLEVQSLEKEAKEPRDSNISATVKKQIQKLIFDPAFIPFSYDQNNQKIPSNNLQAVAVKVQLDSNSYTWLITWANLLSISPNLVTNAAELQMIPTLKNNQELTYEEIQQPANYIYFEPASKPAGNLVYKVTNVSFANEDINKLTANVTVQVSHPDIETTKEYTTTVTSGFQSKPYVDLYNQVKSATSNFTNMDGAKPSIAAKTGITKNDFLKNFNNLSWLKENLTITAPTTLTSAEYTINWSTLSNDSTKILLSLSISSANDPNNFIKHNLVTQEILVEFTIPTTIRTGQLLAPSSKNNKVVFLDS